MARIRLARVVFILLLASWSPATTAGVEIRTALGDHTSDPEFHFQQTFSCTDNVFAVIDISDYPPDLYQLGIRWLDPSGTQREYSRHDFRLVGNKDRVWGWVKLHRASGAGMLRWLDPSAGMEEFIGHWQVVVELDERQVGEAGFDVIC